MSDIQEQIKLAHKRAEENDNRNELYGVKVIVSPEAHKELLKKQMIEENKILNDLQNRIDKAIEYINEMCLCSDGYADYGDDLRPEHIVNILQGKEK